jgi:hypothetical protein
MSHLSVVTRLGAAVFLGAHALASAATAGAIEREFSSEPAAPLVAFARARHIPLEKIEIDRSQPSPRKGDRVTLLITLVRGAAREQWVATLTSDALTPAEAALKPEPPAIIYTFTGQKLMFERTRTALEVYLAGPFSVPGTNEPSREPLEAHHRTLVTAEYLVHGVEPFCRSAVEVGPRMRARGWSDRDGYAAGFGPFPDAALQVGRRFAEKYQLTGEEERLENEAYLAMVSFFDTARGIPEFNRLAKTAIDFPSLWSLTKNFGLSSTMLFRWVDVSAAGPAGISIPQPAYRFPLTVLLNQTVATRAMLVVTAPHPPLQVSAGILAIVADHPTDRTRHFALQVIAARRGSD